MLSRCSRHGDCRGRAGGTNYVMSTDPAELARQIVAKEYAQFCVARKMRPSKSAAQAFAVEVTESGAKPYHGMTDAELVAMLCAKLPG